MKRGLCARRALVAVTVIIAATVILAPGCASRRQPQGDAAPQGPAGASRTIQDGIYTEEQSLRGEAVYFTTCVLCHKPELAGTEIIPTLIGEKFLARWNRRSVGDLFELMRTSMPPLVTQRRTSQEYADVLAYLLNRNEFPAGPEELPSEFADLTGIRMAPGESN